jgi:SAM-dependent methyltransferase
VTAEVARAWDAADPRKIHPAREHVSEAAYWASGRSQADALATVLPAGCAVLDFGCGDGRVTIPLSRLGYRVTAADSSPHMLAALTRREPALATVLTDGRGLRTALGAQVDAVICLAVLIHYGWDGGSRMVAHLAGAVRPGGLLVLDWPASPAPCEAASWIGVTTWDAGKRSAAAAACGLEPVTTGLPWSVWRRP